jgi:hypothetical protein
MASSLPDLITDSKLEVESFKDYSIQTRLVSNPATGQRRTRQQERWQRIKELGRGSFGTVWLEECTAGPSSGEVRAVKELCKNPTSVSTNYYRELEAIAKFSQERVSTVDILSKEYTLIMHSIKTVSFAPSVGTRTIMQSLLLWSILSLAT